jgi:hypothetical protein
MPESVDGAEEPAGSAEQPLACEECDAAKAVPGDGSGEIVGRRGGDFYLRGRPFKHVGVNAALLYQPRDQVVFTLGELKKAGIKHVRFSVPNTAMAGSNWDPVEIKSRLRAVLDLALAHDIRATLTLGGNFLEKVHRWEGRDGLSAVYGDEPFYTREVGLPGLTLKALNDSWIDWGYARSGGYKDFVWNIVASFKDHAGVFAWEIVNEVNVSDTSNGWLVDRELAFYKEMAALIKATDPNHLVATGLISTHWAGLTTDQQKDSLYGDPNIDYVTVHEYDDGTPVEENDDDNAEDMHSEKDDLRRANERWNKPVIIGEFGMSGPNTFDRVRAYYAKHYAGAAAFQVDAIMVFQMQYSCPAVGGNDWGSGHGLYGPCEQNKIRPYMGLWGRWAGQVDPSAPLIVDNYYVNNDTNRTQVSAPGSVWTPSTYSPQHWGTGYQVSTANGGATGESDAFEFRFHLPSAACKAIDGWWNGNYSRSSAVPYVALNASGHKVGDTMYANQQINSDAWVEVGRRCFSAGWNKVLISRWTNAPGYIIADAIRIRD